MSRIRSCVYVLVFSSFLAASGQSAFALSASSSGENGRSAVSGWADVDGDGRLELAAVGADGVLKLLAATGARGFEDVSESVGLAGIANAALPLWLDYDADGRLDLFVGARAGASRLFRNEGGVFADVTASAGLASEGPVWSADWVDHDGDGRADLHVVTGGRHELHRGLAGGFLERIELPIQVGPDPIVGEATPLSDGALPLTAPPCKPAIEDQASPGTCLLASSTPVLGQLYPLSTNLFVALGGNVGIGTTSPSARLDVAGTARMSGFQLTSGAAASRVLTSDAAGNGTWQAPAVGIDGSGTATRVPKFTAGTTLGDSVITENGAGNVGIGTTGPAAKLDVAGTTRTSAFQMPTAASAGRVLTSDATGNGTWQLPAGIGGAGTPSQVPKFMTPTSLGNSGIAEDASGNVGIGTTSPTARLDVAGTTRTGGFRMSSGAGAGRVLTSDTMGNASWQIPSGIGGSGTGGRLSKFTASATVGDSVVVEDGSGNVGVGTASPTAKLDVAGTARVTGTLTLGGHVNLAGDIYRGSALFIHTAADWSNTAVGREALSNATPGLAYDNTALGQRALRANTSGSYNTAVGKGALVYNTTGNQNTACGSMALAYNATGVQNTATGRYALGFNGTGSNNTACGYRALLNNTSGSNNIALGRFAGSSLTNGSSNISIGNSASAGESSTIRIGTAGTHVRTFIAGIHGVQVFGGLTVMIDSLGQLGTTSSSRRFKQDIADMGDRTERLLELRPVVFRYRQEQETPAGGEPPLEYGLIAEEVAEVFPDLVVLDDEGKPFTVKYHLLSAMLLNELQKLHARSERDVRELSRRLEEQQMELARLRALEARLEALEWRVDPRSGPEAARDR